MKYIYVLIGTTCKIHYGAYADEQTARSKAREFEKLDNLKIGEISVFEIPETWMFGFKVV